MVGDILSAKREEKGLSLREIASRTHIRLDYIRYIENSIFEKIPSDIYVKGYLRAYAKVLGLDAEDILDVYCEDRPVTEEVCEELVEPHVKRIHAKKYVYGVCGTLLLLMALFILYKFDLSD